MHLRNSVIVLYAIFSLHCGLSSAKEAALPTGSFLTDRSTGLELVVQPYYLSDTMGTVNADGNNPLILRVRIWLRNVSENTLTVITSEKPGFVRQETLLSYFFKPKMLDASPLRARPSELDLVTLNPKEAVFIQDVQYTTTIQDLKVMTIRVTYKIDPSASKMYGVWTGSLEVPYKPNAR